MSAMLTDPLFAAGVAVVCAGLLLIVVIGGALRKDPPATWLAKEFDEAEAEAERKRQLDAVVNPIIYRFPVDRYRSRRGDAA